MNTFGKVPLGTFNGKNISEEDRVSKYEEALSSVEERKGVFLSTCFLPLLMAFHGELMTYFWKPDNPG